MDRCIGCIEETAFLCDTAGKNLNATSPIANELTTEDFYIHMECQGPFPLNDMGSQCSMNDL